MSSLVLFCSNRTEHKSLLITEFLAQNKSNWLDSLGKSYDWIELYNNGKKNLDLSEFYISDNAKKPNVRSHFTGRGISSTMRVAV